jgi:hypothetical protein
MALNQENLSSKGIKVPLWKRGIYSRYVLDLGGNVRKNPQLSGSTHNVFGIQVGVSINLLS